MTHEDAGHYAAKHPQGTPLNADVAVEIQSRANEGTLSCAAAHSLAEAMGVSPAEVGRNMDLLELRLTKCQLGLFGYSPAKKVVVPAETVAGDLETALQDACVDGRLSCEAAWQIADQRGIIRLDLSAACEALKIKVKPCQLGAF